jgi:hypothetical protein
MNNGQNRIWILRFHYLKDAFGLVIALLFTRCHIRQMIISFLQIGLRYGSEESLKIHIRCSMPCRSGYIYPASCIPRPGIWPDITFTHGCELGNTGCASAPLVIVQNIGKFKSSEFICMSVFGEGYSLGTYLFKMHWFT